MICKMYNSHEMGEKNIPSLPTNEKKSEEKPVKKPASLLKGWGKGKVHTPMCRKLGKMQDTLVKMKTQKGIRATNITKK